MYGGIGANIYHFCLWNQFPLPDSEQYYNITGLSVHSNPVITKLCKPLLHIQERVLRQIFSCYKLWGRIQRHKCHG